MAAPTAAARALSVEGVAPLPTRPAAVTLQCLARDDGAIGDCIEAGDGGTRDPRLFHARVTALSQTTDPLLRAARERTAFYRLPPARHRRETRSVVIRERVSATDAAPTTPAVPVAQGELSTDPAGAVDPCPFYPSAALRAGVQTRVAVTCRVLADRSLLCRDPTVDLPPITGDRPMWRDPAFDGAFARATRRAFAAFRVRSTLTSGGDSLGREGRWAMNWRLGD